MDVAADAKGVEARQRFGVGKLRESAVVEIRRLVGSRANPEQSSPERVCG